ncbi:MAG TPA: thioredoxin domain-containing protein, partial [Polyangiales bacterium]
PRSISNTVHQIPVTVRDPQQGPADALVTLVMFGDFEDPFTRRGAETVNVLRQKYNQELRVVWKDLPLAFHDHAARAATLAQVAFAQGGDELFWQAHAVLVAHQDALTDADLKRYGAELGLDVKRLETALSGDTFADKFAADKSLVPRLIPIYTTPLFTINGRFIRGAVAANVFETTIEQEIAKAKAMVAAGTPQKDVYATIIRDGRTEDAELTPEQKAAANKVYDVALPKDAPSKGPANAPVVIQEFADFQCPFCAQAESVLAELMREFPGKIRLVWRDYPLPIHPDASLAAEAAREVFRQAKASKFWKYHDLLFANQSALSRAELERHAQSLGGIDMTAFRRALDRHTQLARVQSDVAAYAKSGSRLGTPGFFINGHLLEGALPIEFFRPLIRSELAASASK